MAARRGKTQDAKQTKVAKDAGEVIKAPKREKTQKEVIDEHLPPLLLTYVVLICSGAFLMFSMRDAVATGKNIAGSWDEAMLLFTKSTDWYDESKGWKSTQGGFSAIQQFSTDGNNMGGLFVRKLAGAAAAGVHAQKLVPLVIHPTGAQWAMGHYRPLLSTALVGNLALLAFYASYLHDLVSGGAGTMTYGILATLAVESLVILAYLVTARPSKRGPAVAMPDGKTPSSLTSRILSRTVMLVSPILAAVAVRDLLFPGFVFSFLPRDDIYLEWTNAFLHSPPEGSEEELDQGLTAPLYIGDKFVSQLAAVNILIICLYKCVTSFVIRYGSDGSGLIKCRMIWQVQAFAGAFVTFVFRLFTPAARAVGFDFRWHLMCLSYETFIIFLYAYF